jgi:hypothetical protein
VLLVNYAGGGGVEDVRFCKNKVRCRTVVCGILFLFLLPLIYTLYGNEQKRENIDCR